MRRLLLVLASLFLATAVLAAPIAVATTPCDDATTALADARDAYDVAVANARNALTNLGVEQDTLDEAQEIFEAGLNSERTNLTEVARDRLGVLAASVGLTVDVLRDQQPVGKAVLDTYIALVVALDEQKLACAPETTAPSPTGEAPLYADCAAAEQAGAAPLIVGQDGYRPELDPDGNAVACEPAAARTGQVRVIPRVAPQTGGWPTV